MGLAWAVYCVLFEAMPARLPFDVPYPPHFATSVGACMAQD